MPNHIKHIVSVVVGGERKNADGFFNAIGSESRIIDFDKIIPMPDIIKLPDGSHGFKSNVSDAAELVMLHRNWPVFDYRGQKASSPINYRHQIEWEDADFKHFEQCCRAIMETGYSNWHPWSVVHWGTKWNAYDIEREGDIFKFQTAWNTPMKIWEKLCEMFPDIHIRVMYADEDFGSNCGIITIVGGDLVREQKNNEDFAFEVWEWTQEQIDEYHTEIAEDI